MDLLTLLVFVLVFGGMVFLHELGHFLAARLFKIPVEEFGFGFPPRVFRFWRSAGEIVINDQRVEIPANFDYPFYREDALNKIVKASADSQNGRLVLRTIEVVKSETAVWPVDAAQAGQQTNPLPETNPKKESATRQPGAIQLSGVVRELDMGTEFTINLLPIGGFVRPRGEMDPDISDGLAAANPWKRLGVLFAGPLMNLLTAVVVLSIIIAQTGVAVPGKVLIENVSEASPAQEAGILPNDIIVSIQGQPVTTLDEARALIRASLDAPLEVVVLRDEQQVTLTATPLSSRSAEQGALGVGLGYPRRAATLGEIVGGGFTYTGIQAVSLLYIPIGLIQGVIAPDQARLVGIKGIYDFLGEAIQRDSESRQQPVQQPGSSSAAPAPTNYVLSLIATLSVSLAVMNLLPIPALDGGRILFTLPEILLRRRIPPRLENIINGVAMLALIAFMLFVNIMDFVNPISTNLP